MSIAPTVDPSLAIPASVLTSYINNITLSNQTILANGTTPESKALAWMITNDTALDTAAVISKDNPIAKTAIDFRIRQLYPLLVMWFQQTDIKNWALTNKWLVNPNECTWYGIACNNKIVLYFYDKQKDMNYVGNQNAITDISFKLLSSYVGIIPEDIGLLTDLEKFEIVNTYGEDVKFKTYLTGTLPDSIGLCTALTYFDVSRNIALTGTLPNSIGQWTALTYFNVGGNGINGTVPDSVGQWNDLILFHVSGNGLYGHLPNSIGQWTALTYFDISLNYLNGTLPESIGQWTALTSFSVIENFGVTGTLPKNIGKWTALKYFNIDSIALNGTLSDNIGLWTAIIYFDVGFNGLEGTLPGSIGQ
jgi:hypothetical protein